MPLYGWHYVSNRQAVGSHPLIWLVALSVATVFGTLAFFSATV